jgi:hypothetical protein
MIFLKFRFWNNGIMECWDIQVFKSSSLPVFKSSSLQVFQSSSLPVFQSSSLPVFQSSSLQVFQSSSLQVFQSSSLPVFQSSSPTTKISLSHKVFKYSDMILNTDFCQVRLVNYTDACLSVNPHTKWHLEPDMPQIFILKLGRL